MKANEITKYHSIDEFNTKTEECIYLEQEEKWLSLRYVIKYIVLDIIQQKLHLAWMNFLIWNLKGITDGKATKFCEWIIDRSILID